MQKLYVGQGFVDAVPRLLCGNSMCGFMMIYASTM